MNYLRISLAFLCLIFLPASGKADPVSTTRDSFGVPTISGGDLASVSRAIGQAHAEDRLWQIFLQNIAANGRLSQYFGSSNPDFLLSDIFQREINPTDEEVKNEIQKFFTKETLIAFENYVQGLNDQVDAVNNSLAPRPYELIVILGPTTPIPHFTLYDNLRSVRFFLQSFSPTQNPQFQLSNLAALMTLSGKFGDAEGMAIFEDLDPTSTQVRSLYTIMNNNNSTPPPFKTHMTHREMVINTEEKTQSANQFKSSPNYMGTPAISHVQAFADKIKRIKDLHRTLTPGLGSNGQVIGPKKSATGNPLLRCAIQPNFNHPSDFYQVKVDNSFFSGNYFIVPGIPFGIGMYNTFGFTVQTGHLPTNDYLFEPISNVSSSRQEIIQVAGSSDVVITVYRSSSGGWVIENPFPDMPTIMLTLRSAFIERQLQGLNIVGDLPFIRSVPEFFRKALAFDHSSDLIGFEGQCADCDGNFGAFQATDWTEIPPVYDRRLPQGVVYFIPPNHTYNLRASARKPMYDINNPQGFYCGWNNLFKQFAAGSADTISGLSLSRVYWLIDYLNSFNKISFEDLKQTTFRQAVASSIVAFNNARPTAYADLFTPLFKEKFFETILNQPSLTSDQQQALALLQNFTGNWFDGTEAQVITTPNVSDSFILASAWLLNVAAEILNPYIGCTGGSGCTGCTGGTYFEIDAGSAGVLNSLPSVNCFDASNALAVYQGNLLARILGTSSDNTLVFPGWLTDVDVDTVIIDSLNTAISNLGGFGARPWGINKRPIYKFQNAVLGTVKTMLTFNASGVYFVTEFGPKGITQIETVLPLGESGLVLLGPSGPTFAPHNFDQFPYFTSFELVPN